MLLALGRIPVLVLLAVYTAIGLADAGHPDDRLLLARALLPIAAYLMFSVACNDLSDERIDRVNLPDDPSRPLVSGGALRGELTVVAVVCGLVALGGAFLLGPWPGLVTAVGIGVSGGYSLRPVRIADRGAFAALTLPACYVAVPYLVGRLAAGPWPQGRGWLLPAALYIGFIGRILLKDFRDVRGDALFGKRTFLVRHGRVWTCRFSAVCWTLGTVLAVAALPGVTPSLVAVSTAYLGAALWLLHRLSRDDHPRREALLISAAAIVGRGLLLTVLAQLSVRPLHWSPWAQAATLLALLVLTLGQASTMLREGPASRLRVPAHWRHDSERVPADVS